MNGGRLTTLIQSRAFGAVAYAVLAILIGLYVYERFFRANRVAETLNLSCFIFRDDNRNGLYEVGERALADVEVVMTFPGGGTVTAAANGAGFANFTMSREARQADVRREGPATIRVRPPHAWSITSGNAEQTTTFRFLAGSPVGIIAERTFQPVGLAPDLTISGLVGPVRGAPGQFGTLRAISPAGAATPVPIGPDGRFALAATAGEWRLDYTGSDGTVSRLVRVDRHPVVVGSLHAGRSAPAAGREPVTADFDRITTSDGVMEVPNGYVGLQWYNWVAMHRWVSKGGGAVNATISGEYLAYNSSGHPATISAPRPFDFVGGHVGLVWPGAEPADLVVRAWRGQELAYEDRWRGRVSGSVYFAADYRDITRIEFSSATYWQLAIDDLQFRVVGSVPATP